MHAWIPLRLVCGAPGAARVAGIQGVAIDLSFYPCSLVKHFARPERHGLPFGVQQCRKRREARALAPAAPASAPRRSAGALGACSPPAVAAACRPPPPPPGPSACIAWSSCLQASSPGADPEAARAAQQGRQKQQLPVAAAGCQLKQCQRWEQAAQRLRRRAGSRRRAAGAAAAAASRPHLQQIG